jgi:2-dehydro-3-deoxyglucarate aldolase/4-hydroxy-2-oxoheptanedioate aldolase
MPSNPLEGRGPQSLRDRILAGEQTVGTFLNLGSSVSAEICAMAGYDWVLIDLEHGSGTAADLLGQLQAVSGTGATPLVRVERTTRTHVSRALDPGAAGIMFPRIETAAESREAVQFLRFPPDGIRGVASQTRTGRFGAVPIADLGRLAVDVIAIVQVETLRSLSELDAIAAIDGVDVLFVGPADLTYALGVPGRLDDRTYLEALEAVVDAAVRAGCCPGILVRDVAQAAIHLERGFRFIGIGSDSSHVMAGAAAAVAGFRAVRAEAERSRSSSMAAIDPSIDSDSLPIVIA